MHFIRLKNTLYSVKNANIGGFNMKAMTKVITVLALAIGLSACNNLSESQRNTAIGAAIGGVAGNVIGNSTEATLGGAALGGVIGSQVGK